MDQLHRKQQFHTAINLIADLLSILPPGSDLAAALAAEYSRVRAVEGNSPLVAKLRRSYQRIEETLNACRALTLSSDVEAVDQAEGILQCIAARTGEARLRVKRGDLLSVNNHGAAVVSIFPGKLRLELVLRKTHFESDENHLPHGHWIIEGGVWPVDGGAADCALPYFEEYIGLVLPPNIEERMEDKLRICLRACIGGNGNVIPLFGGYENQNRRIE